MVRRKCVYFNTNSLIRAVNPRESGHVEMLLFIGELSRREYPLVISSVHKLERFKPDTRAAIDSLLRLYGFKVCRVDVSVVRKAALKYIRKQRYSESRLLDIMHLVAGRLCGCGYFVAVDRFMRAHAKEFGLKYINYYTGIP